MDKSFNSSNQTHVPTKTIQKPKLNEFYVLDTSTSSFRNEDMILKLNSMQMLKFFKDELTIKYIGKGYNVIDYASAQSNKTISHNKLHPIFYFEVEIIEEGSKKDITIGFSDKDFVLNKQCGTTSKSYGYNGEGKKLHDKAKGESFGPKFKQKDIIGCGYYFSKNSIFYTLNGKFIGWAFTNVDSSIISSYATVSLHSLNEKVTVNFGKSNFLFDIEGFYSNQININIRAISEITVEKKDLDYLVREYLVHSGYQESFIALEKEKEVPDVQMLSEEDIYNELRFTGESVRKESIDEDLFRKYSADDGLLKEPTLRKRTLSLMVDRLNDEKDSKESQEDIFMIMNFLKERKVIHNMILGKEYDLALNYFLSNFQPYRSKKEINWKKIILCLTILKYLERLRKDDYQEAFQIIYNLEKDYWNKEITIPLYDSASRICDFSLENLSLLLCYENVSHSELSFLFLDEQIIVICDQINSLILEFAGVSSDSILEKVFKQQNLVNHVFMSIKNCHGEKLKLII